MTNLITLYARREPTTDTVCKQYLPPKLLKAATDIQLYYDPDCTRPAVRYRYGMRRPTRSSRTVVHNCNRYALEWLPPRVSIAPLQPAHSELRNLVLSSFYERASVAIVDGYQLLCGRYLPTNSGIFVINGDFGRAAFKLAIQEAHHASLDVTRIYAYGHTGSYSGPAICFTKFDDLSVTP